MLFIDYRFHRQINDTAYRIKRYDLCTKNKNILDTKIPIMSFILLLLSYSLSSESKSDHSQSK